MVDALLDTLGPAGTLVVPAFTFAHGSKADPVFDMARDPSEMGQITEATRRRPEARRSCHLLHSVAALGQHAPELTANHGPSAWAADGPFWKLRELGGHILLLGVPYLCCTFFHLIEQMVQIPYRRWVEQKARARAVDGREHPLPVHAFTPRPEFPGNDFNKFGILLEKRGCVRKEAVGNAVARLFSTSDALELGIAQYRKDPLLFVRCGPQTTPLEDCVFSQDLRAETCVVDPFHIYRGTVLES